MKILITLLILTFRAYAPEYRELVIAEVAPTQPYESLWNATCYVETRFNTLAIGDTALVEHSYGIAQIRNERLQDYYLATGINYSVTDMFDPVKSKEVFMFYASGSDLEVIARTWNGGPTGMNKESTLEYWKLIKSQL